MKKSILLWSVLFALFSGMTLVSCDNDDDDEVNTTDLTIVEFAQSNSNYSLLVDAVVRAGLVDVLSAPGELTVFAPDNNAFNAFLSANNFNSIDDIPVETLEAVLLYHVLGAKVNSTDITGNVYVTTASPSAFGNNPLSMYINIDNGIVINGGAEVAAADIEVSNGVIHGIDQVIGLPDVTTFAIADPAFATLTSALTASQLNTDLVSALQAAGPFTVFAPTNQAFQDLLDSNPDWSDLSDIPGDLLETVLLYHVSAAGNVRSTDLVNEMSVPTLAQQNFTIDLTGNTPTIQAGQNSAGIIFTDVQATNGVIHVINTVILPSI
ncbi:MAG: fasciclin domain-containing protein [Saprospiraceae bacterium]|nr:fasciclin domain-containing protein [Saprospiraceae bacterium]